MIAKDQNIALLIVGNAALKNSDWTEYANYCFAREKGLRKEAFKYLENFLKSTAEWTFEQKIGFVKFLFPFFETVEDADYGPFPQPLSDKLIKPTLTEWCETEKTDENPFRWYGKYYRSEEHLFKALEINPKDDLARQTILGWWIDDIYNSVHHLPDYYIGEPLYDIQLSEKIKSQIQQLTTSELKEYWTKELEQDLELVKNYINWKNSGHQNFEKWGTENNKRTSNGTTTIYYNEE
ncbi:MAG TPA: hypothetical protein VF455_04240 [Chryseobacterium sp.]